MSILISRWVPITAPFSTYSGPGEVKLVDGDLVYVKLRPGTFSRQDDLQNLLVKLKFYKREQLFENYNLLPRSYQRLERKNMLRVKHLWPDQKDLILVIFLLKNAEHQVSHIKFWPTHRSSPT